MIIVNCTSSDKSLCIGGWSTEGVETIILENGTVVCQAYHLTVIFSFSFFFF